MAALTYFRICTARCACQATQSSWSRSARSRNCIGMAATSAHGGFDAPGHGPRHVDPNQPHVHIVYSSIMKLEADAHAVPTASEPSSWQFVSCLGVVLASFGTMPRSTLAMCAGTSGWLTQIISPVMTCSTTTCTTYTLATT